MVDGNLKNGRRNAGEELEDGTSSEGVWSIRLIFDSVARLLIWYFVSVFLTFSFIANLSADRCFGRRNYISRVVNNGIQALCISQVVPDASLS